VLLAARRTTRAHLPVAAALVAALAFVVVRPPVGDLWAARARASAAAHGVGLRYWFAWFGGTVPGHYSVLEPYLATVIPVVALGALSTVGVAALCYWLVRGSRHAQLAAWTGAIVGSFSLWSGRIPFALGLVPALAALVAIRNDRRALAAVAATISALVSPVCAAFLLLGLAGVVVHDARRRVAALCAGGAAAVVLAAVAVYFGSPGPEGFGSTQALLCLGGLAALLVARPPAIVRTVVLLSVAACPLLVLVPNGLGSNFERFVWICLPVAVAATGRARTWVVVMAVVAASASGVVQSIKDLHVAAQPMSSPGYYDGLVAELRTLPDLRGYRLEVVPDGTHVAAFALLDAALLARGYETQSDNALNSTLTKPGLDAATYRRWLSDQAVGYVVIDNTTLVHNPEDRLVRSGALPYLQLFWSDANLRLYRVSTPTPVVAPPGRIADADQAELVLDLPSPGTYLVRVHWSRFLRVETAAKAPARGATLTATASGWTDVTVPAAGTYTLAG
jgi:hypothetical protein